MGHIFNNGYITMYTCSNTIIYIGCLIYGYNQFKYYPFRPLGSFINIHLNLYNRDPNKGFVILSTHIYLIVKYSIFMFQESTWSLIKWWRSICFQYLILYDQPFWSINIVILFYCYRNIFYAWYPLSSMNL